MQVFKPLPQAADIYIEGMWGFYGPLANSPYFLEGSAYIFAYAYESLGSIKN